FRFLRALAPPNSNWIPISATPASLGRGRFRHVVEQFEGFIQMRMEVVTHQVEDLAEDRIAEGVENLAAILAAVDDLLRSQHGQVLRDVGLFEPEPLANPTDRQG